MKARHVGQVSFNLRDGFEARLYEYAYKTEHGDFSRYIKRLIERDMSQARAPSVTVEVAEIVDVDASSFL